MQVQCTPDIETLDRLCRLVNRESFALSEARNTCIFTAAALRDILTALGIQSDLMRVEAVGNGPKGPAMLGSFGDGSRRPAAGPGMWNGHVAVIAIGRYLLDPTLDQIDGLEPFVGEVTDAWLRGEQTCWWVDGKLVPGFPGYDICKSPSVLRYHAFPNRCGWKGAGDFRPSRRRTLISDVLATWEG